jgi:transposase
MEATMKLELAQAPTTTALQLRLMLRDRFGINVSRQLVGLVIRKRLGYTRKRTRKRGPTGVGWTPSHVDAFKQSFMRAYSEGRLSAWDESGFDHRCRTLYGYAPSGERAVLNVQRSRCKPSRCSLLMAVHMDGSCCEQTLQGSVTASHFAQFVLSCPLPSGTTVLLDNHSMHKTAVVKAAAREKGYELLFTPPYSPQFNPIELVFGGIKSTFYKLRYTDHFGDDLHESVHRCVRSSATSPTIAGCFAHVERVVSGARDF